MADPEKNWIDLPTFRSAILYIKFKSATITKAPPLIRGEGKV